MTNRIVWMLPVILLTGALLPAAAPQTCTPPAVSCGCGCCPPDGGQTLSSRSAYALAQPSAATFAGDAELRQILGSEVSPAGELSTAGSWSFIWYSPSKAQTLQVTVSATGALTPTTRAEGAPGPGIVHPAPANWADSLSVFGATDGHRAPAATVAQLVVFNVTSFPAAPGQAVWGLNFNAGQNQLVSATGAYLGAQ